MNRILMGAAVLGLLAALVPHSIPADAAVVPMTLEDLVERADLCVRGQVTSAAPSWTEDGQMIVTTYTVQVTETLMGTAPASVLVRVPGGQIGNLRIASSEAPAYGLGEEVVAFLNPHPAQAGSFGTCGWFQGKLTVLGGMVRERLDTSYDELRDEILAAVEAR